MSSKKNYTTQYAQLAPEFLAFLDAEEARIVAQMTRVKATVDDEVSAETGRTNILARLRSDKRIADDPVVDDEQATVPLFAVANTGDEAHTENENNTDANNHSADSQKQKNSPLAWIQNPALATDNEPQAPIVAEPQPTVVRDEHAEDSASVEAFEP